MRWHQTWRMDRKVCCHLVPEKFQNRAHELDQRSLNLRTKRLCRNMDHPAECGPANLQKIHCDRFQRLIVVC